MGELERFIQLRKIQMGRSPIEIPNMGRAQLAEVFGQLGYRTGAEVGVYKGEFSEIICKANPGVTLHCIDPYALSPYYADMAGALAEAKQRLQPYDVTFIQAASMVGVRQFADNSLDFVYLDGDHSWPGITQDLYHWHQKVRPGGILAGHDYIHRKSNKTPIHVIEAVNGFTGAFKIEPWFLIGTRAKRAGEVRDQHRSWMWIK